MNETKSNTDIHERDSLIVGHITGRVLHEFNNVLQGIIGLAEMLDADPKVPEKAKISVKAIRRLGQNATQMINKLGQEDHVSESGTRNIVAVATAMPTEVPQKTKMSILVAEDDPLVLNVIKGMLKQLGYSTIVASDGEEAYQLFNENSDSIAMVISDLVMPIMGGLDLAEKLLVDKPEIKIVIMTGYLQEELELDPEEFGLAGWLEKPMTAERLRQVVDPIMQNQK